MPWCIRKCPYCDFNSYPRPRQALPEQAYVERLIADLEQELGRIADRTVVSVFIGGGTPSLFSPEALERLLRHVQARVALAADCEITLEANPGTVDERRLTQYRAVGINRLSLGVQSFHDRELAQIGRLHSAAQARLAVEGAMRAGFARVNLDLMYGLPGQCAANALRDVCTAIELGVSHISHYQLTIEPGTCFSHHCPRLPAEEAIAQMQALCEGRLLASGFGHYETSAYARDGHHCQHNLNYWCFGDYLGIGAGAHGKLTDVERQTVIRSVKQPRPGRYLSCARAAELTTVYQHLQPRQVAVEFLINALRLVQGFTISMFESRTGLPARIIEEMCKEALARDLIEYSSRGVRPTGLGRRFLDDLLALCV